MPNVTVLYAFDGSDPSPALVASLSRRIKQEFCMIAALELEATQVSVHFPRSQVDIQDLPRPELIVRVPDLYKKPERTQDVLDALARSIVGAVREDLPKPSTFRRYGKDSTWRIVVLIKTWGPDPLYAEACNDDLTIK